MCPPVFQRTHPWRLWGLDRAQPSPQSPSPTFQHLQDKLIFGGQAGLTVSPDPYIQFSLLKYLVWFLFSLFLKMYV